MLLSPLYGERAPDDTDATLMWGKILSTLGSAAKSGGKAVATGNAQAKLGLQSGDLPTAAVRIGRFLYTATLSVVGVAWYTGYVNARTQPGSPKFIVPGSGVPVIGPVDRPKKSPSFLSKVTTPGGSGSQSSSGNGGGGGNPGAAKSSKGRTLVALSPDQLGVPGTAMAGFLWTAPNGQKQIPAYNAATYRQLVHAASSIAGQYGLHITSGYRAGDGGLHGSGLAFDMVGSVNNMKRAASWASNYPGLFQEIFVHNEGSGLHLHIAFYPDAAKNFTTQLFTYQRGSGTKPGTPIFPG